MELVQILHVMWECPRDHHSVCYGIFGWGREDSHCQSLVLPEPGSQCLLPSPVPASACSGVYFAGPYLPSENEAPLLSQPLGSMVRLNLIKKK